jgi:hypothetical protein
METGFFVFYKRNDDAERWFAPDYRKKPSIETLSSLRFRVVAALSETNEQPTSAFRVSKTIPRDTPMERQRSFCNTKTTPC